MFYGRFASLYSSYLSIASLTPSFFAVVTLGYGILIFVSDSMVSRLTNHIVVEISQLRLWT